MTFEAAVLSALRGYVTFKGRASRSEFWWFQMFCVLVYVALLCLGTLLAPDAVTVLLLLLAWLGLLLPWISLAVRRLYDVGLQGAWLLLLLVPFGGITWIAVFAMLSLAPDKANAYGPPPGWSPLPNDSQAISRDAGPSVPLVPRRQR